MTRPIDLLASLMFHLLVMHASSITFFALYINTTHDLCYIPLLLFFNQWRNIKWCPLFHLHHLLLHLILNLVIIILMLILKTQRPSLKGGKEIKQHRYAFQTRSHVDILDDGYRWRKYGEKSVKNNKFPRFVLLH